MIIPDLTRSGKSSFDLRPHCIEVRPRRKAPSTLIQWTVVLLWDLADSELGNVQLPRQFRKLRPEMLAAFEDDGVAFSFPVHPRKKVELDLVLHVGSSYLPAVTKASAVVKTVELKVSPGTCRIKATLVVEASRELAPNFCDLLDSDVSVEIRATGDLPFPDLADEDEEEEADDPQQESVVLGAGQPPAVETLENESNPPAVDIERPADSAVRRRKARQLEVVPELPPEPQ